MPARRLAGRWVADAVLDEVRATVAGRGPGVRPPGLAAILVGDDPASQVYVRNKIEACARCGIVSRLETRPAAVSPASLAALVEELNSAPDVDGILLQLPLPARLD